MTCKYSSLFKAATFSACLSLLEIFFSTIINDRFANDASAAMLTPSLLIVVLICGISLNCVRTHQALSTFCGKFCRSPLVINRTLLRETGQVAYVWESKHPAFRQLGFRPFFIDFLGNSRSPSSGSVHMRLVSQPLWNFNEMSDCVIKPNHYETDFTDKL